MSQTRSQILITAKDETRSALQSVSQGVSRMAGDIAQVNTLMQGWLTAKAASQAYSFGKAVVDARIEVDRFRSSMTASVGAQQVATELSFVRMEAERMGLPLQASAEAYAKFSASMKGSALEGDEARKIFTSVSQAGSVLSLSADDMSGVFRALTQMMSKGTVQAEELKGQLGERIPMAMQVAAKAMGVTQAELSKQMEAGAINSAQFVRAWADTLSKEVAPGVVSAAQSMQAQVNRLGNAWTELKQTVASGPVGDMMASGFGSAASVMKELNVHVSQHDTEIKAASESAAALGNNWTWLAARADLFGDSVRLLGREVIEYRQELERIAKLHPAPLPIATQSQVRSIDNPQMASLTTGSLREVDAMNQKFRSPAKQRADEIADARRLQGLTGRDMSGVIAEINRRGAPNGKSEFAKAMDHIVQGAETASQAVSKLRREIEGFHAGDAGKVQAEINDLVDKQDGLKMVGGNDKDAARGVAALESQINAKRELLELMTKESELQENRKGFDESIAAIRALDDAAIAAMKTAEQELIGLQEENRWRGLLRSEIEADKIARLEEQTVLDQSLGASAAQVAAKQKEIDVRRALRLEMKASEAMVEQEQRITKEAQTAKDKARELGATLSSSLEDAIFSGKKASDVLQQLGIDLARLMLRRNFLDPLFNPNNDWLKGLSGAIMPAAGAALGGSGWVSGFDLGNRALGGPVSRGGIYEVVEKGMPEMVRYGSKSYLMSPGDGQVTPMSAGGSGGVTVIIHQNNNVDARADSASIRTAMMNAKNEAVAAVQESMRSGGWAANN